MAYKLLGEVFVDPANTTMDNASLVHVVANADTFVIINIGKDPKRVKVFGGDTIDIVKKPAETIDCPSSECTAIAYHW